MTEEQAIERLEVAIASNMWCKPTNLDWNRHCAKAAWNEIKAIAREEPRYWREMDAYVWPDGMITSEPTKAARHDHMMILERPA